MRPTLIVVTGLPCTGKTTLAEKLSKSLEFPMISKDEIKELVFDTVGIRDREWSKKVGSFSYELMYYFAESVLQSSRSLIIETNFDAQFASKKIKGLKDKYKARVIQIKCITEGKILFERFSQRANSEKRHKGHFDSDNLDYWKPILLQGAIETIDIDDELIIVDTTNFEQIDYNKIINEIKNLLSEKPQKVLKTKQR